MSRVGLALVAALWVTVTPAAAQGFFESLFGFGASPPPPVRTSVPMTPGGRPYAMPSGPMTPRSSALDDLEIDGGSQYRTLCVRTCDGYIFPVSTRTTRRGFYRDQMRCRATCGDDARLFLLPAGTIDTAGAVDIHGRPYTSLRTANLYKRSLVSGCQCRPAPWSASERGRHRAYADAEAGERAIRHAEAIAQVVRDAGGTIEIVEPGAAHADPERDAVVARISEPDPRPHAAPTVVAETAVPTTVPSPVAVARRTKVAPRPIAVMRVAAHTPRPRRVPTPTAPVMPPQVPALFAGPFALGAASTLTWPGDPPRRR